MELKKNHYITEYLFIYLFIIFKIYERGAVTVPFWTFPLCLSASFLLTMVLGQHSPQNNDTAGNSQKQWLSAVFLDDIPDNTRTLPYKLIGTKFLWFKNF